MDKQFETKEIRIKAHVRLIRQRAYRFVCKQCQQVVDRICYPSQPLYCEKCRPPKPQVRSEIRTGKKRRNR